MKIHQAAQAINPELAAAGSVRRAQPVVVLSHCSCLDVFLLRTGNPLNNSWVFHQRVTKTMPVGDTNVL